jgi:hypothetical protein
VLCVLGELIEIALGVPEGAHYSTNWGALEMFIVRLWRGDVALVITYWVFGAVGGVALRLLSPAATYEIMAHSTTMSVFDIQVLLYLWVAFLITYSVFILVAVWRSANKYRIMRLASKGNATLAQGACVLGALSVLSTLLNIFSAQNEPFGSISSSPDERLQFDALVSGLNANLPRNLDSVTTLTRIDVDKSGYQYYETVAAQLDSDEAFLHRMRPLIAQGLCKDHGVKDNLVYNINYQYIYSDQNLRPIGDVLITVADCPNAN